MLTLQELCCRAIVARTTVYSIDQLPLPISIKSHLKSYAMTTYTTMSSSMHQMPRGVTAKKLRSLQQTIPGGQTQTNTLDQSRASCSGRNSCIIS